MNHNVMLTISSMLSILLFMFHLTDDIVRGFEKGGYSNLTAVPIFVVWLYGTLVLAGRRSGYVIIILGGLLSMAALVLHTRGVGLAGGRLANSNGVYFWVWTLLALGVTGLFSVILSAHGLRRLQRDKSPKSTIAKGRGRQSGVHEKLDLST